MRLITSLIVFLVLSNISMATASERVENFRLLDQNRSAHEFYYHKNAKAVVLMVHMNGFPIVRNLLPDLRDIHTQFGDDVEFILINSSLQDTPASVKKEAEEFGIDFTILVDEVQLIGESLKLDRSSEVLVIDTDNWELLYRGL